MENIEYIGGGIKCDNPDCDFKDDTVSIENYKDWLNKPCPKCGQNLLTKEDYNTVQQLLSAIDIVNDLPPNLFGNNASKEKIEFRVEAHNGLKIK